MMILLIAIVAILLVDKDSILFIRVAPPVPGGALFASAAERAYLVLGCLIGAAGGPLQAASRTLLIRMAPKDRIAQYFGLFALTGKVTSFVGPLLIGSSPRRPQARRPGWRCWCCFSWTGLALLARVGILDRSSRRRSGPIPASDLIDRSKVELATFPQNRSLWLWVLAFARTTGGCAACYGSCRSDKAYSR